MVNAIACGVNSAQTGKTDPIEHFTSMLQKTLNTKVDKCQ